MAKASAASKDRDTAIRYISMLSEIPMEPNDISCSELHERLGNMGYDVTVRTMQRDLERLSSRTRKTWADSVRVVPKGFALQPAEIAPDVMTNVFNAMGKGRQLRITNKAGEESVINPTQQIKTTADGNTLVLFTAEDALELRQWLLGFGAEVLVHKPVAVRKWIAEVARELVALYQ